MPLFTKQRFRYKNVTPTFWLDKTQKSLDMKKSIR